MNSFLPARVFMALALISWPSIFSSRDGACFQTAGLSRHAVVTIAGGITGSKPASPIP